MEEMGSVPIVIMRAGMTGTTRRGAQARHDNQFAMRLSLAVGVLMLVGKVSAYLMTGSAAILSDALESVIHVLAVGFAAFSLYLSAKPADRKFPYGYERIAFFSAGFEGALIVLAAISIISTAAYKWIHGLEIERLGTGTLLLVGRLHRQRGARLVPRAHRPADRFAHPRSQRQARADRLLDQRRRCRRALPRDDHGWLPFDPIVAIAVALNIIWSGAQLMYRSVGGLMDYADPARTNRVLAAIEPLDRDLGFTHHGLRVRNTGYRTLVEIHLLFPFAVTLGDAHRRATVLEQHLAEALDEEVEVVTHLESLEDHAAVHRDVH